MFASHEYNQLNLFKNVHKRLVMRYATQVQIQFCASDLRFLYTHNKSLTLNDAKTYLSIQVQSSDFYLLFSVNYLCLDCV